MSLTAYENRLTTAFVELADTLVDSFDLNDFLTALAEHTMGLLALAAASVIVAHPQNANLRAAARAGAGPLDDLVLTADPSPGTDTLHTGSAVADTILDTSASRKRWPAFAPAAIYAGFTRAAAIPLSLRDEVVGSLTLYHNRDAVLSESELRLGRRLAETAAIGILQQRVLAEKALKTDQLEQALQTRMVIEQAKGMIAARQDLSVDEAFALLRRHARSHRRLLADLAREVVDGTADTSLTSSTPVPTAT